MPEDRMKEASLFEESMIIDASEIRPAIRFFTRKGNNEFLRKGGLIPVANIEAESALSLVDWMC